MDTAEAVKKPRKRPRKVRLELRKTEGGAPPTPLAVRAMLDLLSEPVPDDGLDSSPSFS